MPPLTPWILTKPSSPPHVPTQTFNLFDLGGKIQSLFPQYHLDVKKCGAYGVQLHNLVAPGGLMETCLMPYRPHIVVFQGHADMSDVDEGGWDDTRKALFYSRFSGNLSLLIDTVQATGAYMALSAPGVLGETPAMMFAPQGEPRFEVSDAVVQVRTSFFSSPCLFHQPYLTLSSNPCRTQAFIRLFQQIAADHGIPHLNLHAALLARIPTTQLLYDGCVTIDGEHMNNRGAWISARLMGTVIGPWLDHLATQDKTKSSSPVRGGGMTAPPAGGGPFQ